MRNKMLAAAAAISFVALTGTANAAVTLTPTPGSPVYTGPAPTFTFETPAPVTGGAIRTGNVPSVAAQPLGSTGNYLTVGPTDGTPAILNLSAFANIAQISFIWGSVDTYNTLEVLGRDLTTVLATFNGGAVAPPANGDQDSTLTNPLVFLNVTGSDQFNIGGLRLNSTQNAFEIDNVAIQAAIPEPGTWALMLLGFGFIGASMRSRRNRENARVRFAI